MKKISFFLFFLCFWCPCQAVTLSGLITRSRQLIADSPYYTPNPKLTNQKITDFLNEGQRYAISYPWFLIQRTTFSLQGGTTEYGLPSDYQASKRVLIDGVPLPETTLEALDSSGGNWSLVSGGPVQYYTRFTTLTVIGFAPWPTAATTGTITMDYYCQAKDMVNPTDLPFNGLNELQVLGEALARYCAYRYYLLSNNQSIADIYAKEFLSDVVRIRSILESKPNYRPGLSISPLIQR